MTFPEGRGDTPGGGGHDTHTVPGAPVGLRSGCFAAVAAVERVLEGLRVGLIEKED